MNLHQIVVVDTNTNLLNNNSKALNYNSNELTSNSDAVVINSSDIAENSKMVAIAVQNNQGMYSSLIAVSSGFNNTTIYANKASNAIEQVGSYCVDTRTKVNSLKQALEGLIGSLMQAISLQSRLNRTNYSTSIVPIVAVVIVIRVIVVIMVGSSSSSSSSSSRSSGAKTSATILSPFDIITEGADLVQSLKDPGTGKYNWKNIGSALGDMVVNSIKQPIITVVNSVKSGYSQQKIILVVSWGCSWGYFRGITGGVSGLAS